MPLKNLSHYNLNTKQVKKGLIKFFVPSHGDLKQDEAVAMRGR